MFTTAWRLRRTQKPKASLTIFSDLNDESWLLWKQRDKKAQWRKFIGFMTWRRARIRCPSTRPFKICFHRTESTTIRRWKWKTLNSFIRFRWWRLQQNRRFSTTSSCGLSCVAFCLWCRIKSGHHSRTSSASCMEISTTTCLGISALNSRTIGWDLASKLCDKIHSWLW